MRVAQRGQVYFGAVGQCAQTAGSGLVVVVVVLAGVLEELDGLGSLGVEEVTAATGLDGRPSDSGVGSIVV